MAKKIKIDLPKSCAIDRKKVIALIEKIFCDHKVEKFTLRIQAVDESTIADLNRRFRGVLGATDVLSFALEENPLEGEIYICIGQAEIAAKSEGLSLNSELLRLIAHGALHLCGIHHDDEFELEANKELMQKYLIFISE